MANFNPVTMSVTPLQVTNIGSSRHHECEGRHTSCELFIGHNRSARSPAVRREADLGMAPRAHPWAPQVGVAVHIVLHLDGLAERERHRRRA